MTKPEKKIALIGSAPSSVTRAPYDDPSWEIWGVSPGAFPHCKRADTYFEIHSRTLDPSVFSGEYVGFLRNVAKRVFTLEPWPELPNHQIFPFDAMIRKWGPYWFSSSVSWMFAMAIEEGATEIGLWGIDMSSTEEYIGQRPACQWWMEKCKELGIRITLPIESDLNRPFPLYGLVEIDPMYVKMMHRKAELMNRYNQASQQKQVAEKNMTFLEGAVDCINYDIHVWVSDRIMQRYLPSKKPVEDSTFPCIVCHKRVPDTDFSFVWQECHDCYNKHEATLPPNSESMIEPTAHTATEMIAHLEAAKSKREVDKVIDKLQKPRRKARNGAKQIEEPLHD